MGKSHIHKHYPDASCGGFLQGYPQMIHFTFGSFTKNREFLVPGRSCARWLMFGDLRCGLGGQGLIGTTNMLMK